jgi:hypothetical protein
MAFPQFPKLIANRLRIHLRTRGMPDRAVSYGTSRGLTVTTIPGLTWAAAGQAAVSRSLPSWSCRFDPGRLLDTFAHSTNCHPSTLRGRSVALGPRLARQTPPSPGSRPG